MKKLLTATMVLILAVSLLLSACTAQSPTTLQATSTQTSAPYVVKVWMFPLGGDARAAQERTLYDKITKQFESENPGITVDVQVIPWTNRETKMMTAFAAGTGPDCVYLNPDILKLFQFYNVLEPLDEYMDKATRDDFDPSVLAQVTIDGKLYGIPALIDVGVPTYNLDLLAKVGVTEANLPKTWDEYGALLAKLKAVGITGVFFNFVSGPINDFTNAMLFNYGCDIVQPDGKVVIDNEAGLKVLHMITDWYQKGYTPKDSISVDDQGASFISGKVATNLPTDGAGFYATKALDLKFNWAAGPVLSGPAAAFAMGTCASISITNNSKNIPATAKWVNFFTNPQNNSEWCKFSGFLSTRKSNPNLNPGVKGLDIAYANRNNVKGEPSHACARTIGPEWISDIQAICSGTVPFDQGVANLKKGIENIVTNLNAVKPK